MCFCVVILALWSQRLRWLALMVICDSLHHPISVNRHPNVFDVFLRRHPSWLIPETRMVGVDGTRRFLTSFYFSQNVILTSLMCFFIVILAGWSQWLGWLAFMVIGDSSHHPMSVNGHPNVFDVFLRRHPICLISETRIVGVDGNWRFLTSSYFCQSSSWRLWCVSAPSP